MIDYQEILNCINQAAEEYRSGGKNADWVAALTDHDLLEEWINGSREEECPVDLRKYSQWINHEVLDAWIRENLPVDLTENTNGVEEILQEGEEQQLPSSMYDSGKQESDSFSTLDQDNGLTTPRDAIQIERLISDALTALGREDYDKAIDLLNQAIDLDPEENANALQALEKANQLKKDKSRKDLIYTLRYVEDIGDLKKALDSAEAIVRNDPDDVDIAAYMKDCQERYNQIRDTQGAITTAEAIKEYEPVKKAIRDITIAMNRGQKTWNDQRVNEIRPIDEVLNDFQERLGPLALVVLERELAHIHDFMPEQGKREPNAALERLKYALTLDGLEQQKLNELEKKLVTIQEECDKWKRASEELEKADGIDLNSYERFLVFLNAKSIYPYHGDVVDREQHFVRMGAGYLHEVITREIRQIRKKLEGEAQEALNQRLIEEIPGRLTIFDDLRATANELLIKAKRFEETDVPDSIKVNILDLENLINDIEIVESRRNDIRNDYSKILSELKRDPTLAIRTLNELEADRLSDPEISHLRSNLTNYLGAEDNLNYAQKMFDSGKFEEALDSVDSILDPGLLAEEVENLKEKVLLRIYQKEVVQHWAKKYFKEAYDYVFKINRREFKDKAFQDAIILESNLLEKEEEYKERLKVDFQEKIDEKEEKIRRTWSEIEGEDLNEENCLDWLSKAIAIMVSASDVASYESTKEGHLQERAAKIRGAIHDKVFEYLFSLSLESSSHVEIAYKILTKLHEHSLIQSTKDREFRKNALLAYFVDKQKVLELQNRWQEIINLWEKAVREYPDDYSIFESLRINKFNAIVFAIEESLSRYDFNNAIEFASQERYPFEYDTGINLILSVDEEKNLSRFLRQAEVMRRADDLFKKEDYIQMYELLEEIYTETNSRNIYDFKQQLVTNAIDELSEKGIEAIETDLAEGVFCYATILRIDNENTLARAALNNNRASVMEEIEQILDLDDEIDPHEDLRYALEKCISTGKQIDTLLTAANFLLPRNAKEKKQLSDKKSKNAENRNQLERANRIVEDFDNNNPYWKSIITRDNRWRDAEIKVEQLDELANGHSICENLKSKIRTEKDSRKNRVKIKEELEQYFLKDDFDNFLSNYEELMTEIDRESGGANVQARSDKYQVFTSGLNFYDLFSHNSVSFFHHSNEEQPCAYCLVKSRKKNYELFNKYHDDVKSRIDAVKREHDAFDFLRDSYQSLEVLSKIVTKGNSYLLETRPPTEEPISKAATEKLIGDKNLVEEMKSIVNKCKTRLQELVEINALRQKELDEIIELIGDHNYGYDIQLEKVHDFYLEGDNKYQAIIKHILDLKNATATKKANAVEKLISRITW